MAPLILLLCFFSSCSSFPILSSPSPVSAEIALTGTSGLLTIPTADFTQDGHWSWGMGYIPPGHYKHVLGGGRTGQYYIIPMWQNFGYLPHVEISIRLTLIPDAPPPAQNIGIYKDGMASFHVLLRNETQHLPGMAIEARDVYAFAHFVAFAPVATRTVGRVRGNTVRAHLGWGLDWLGGRYGVTDGGKTIPTVHSFLGPFGGADVMVRRNLTGMVEYDTKRVNAGVRWRPVGHTQVDVGVFGFKRVFGGVAFDVNLL